MRFVLAALLASSCIPPVAYGAEDFTISGILKALDRSTAEPTGCANFAGWWVATCTALDGATLTFESKIEQKGCEFLVVNGFAYGAGGGTTLTSFAEGAAIRQDVKTEWSADRHTATVEQLLAARLINRDAHAQMLTTSTYTIEASGRFVAQSVAKLTIHRNGTLEAEKTEAASCVMARKVPSP